MSGSGRRLRARPAALWAAAAVAAALGGGVEVRALAGRHPPSGPLPVVDAWGGDGTVAVAILTVVAALGYLALRPASETRTGARGFVVPLALAGGLLLAFAWWNAAFSSDAYAYAAYGELARLRLDPYLPMPGGALAARDPFLAGAWAHWPSGPPPCLYGPLFTAPAEWLVAGAVAAAGRPDPTALAYALAGFRAAAVGSLVVAAAALAALLPPSKRSAAALFAANPVVLWGALEGHNDAFALALALAGVLAVRRASRRLPAATAAGAAVTALAALAKAPALAAIPFALTASRPGPARVAAIAGTLAGLALVLGPGLALQTPALAHLAGHSRYHPANSLQGVVVGLVAGLAGRRDAPNSGDVALGSALGLLPSAGLALAALGAWRRAARAGGGAAARRGLAEEGALLFGIAAFAGLPNPQPWYGVWFAALAAGTLLRDDGRLSPLALGLWAGTFSVAVRYLGDAAGPPSANVRALETFAQLSPVAVALLVASLRRMPAVKVAV